MDKLYTISYTVYNDSGNGTLTLFLVEQVAVAPGMIPLVGATNQWPIESPTQQQRDTLVKGAIIKQTISVVPAASGSSSSSAGATGATGTTAS